MKLRNTVFFVGVSILVLSGCGQESESTKEKASDPPKKQEEISNKENVKKVVNAVKDEDVRFKLLIDNERNVFVPIDEFKLDGKTYGFDDLEEGTSIYAYADQQGLNEEQAWTISGLATPRESEFTEIMEEYSDDFHKGQSPYEGADFDYTTISNVETEESEKGEEISADVTVHFHNVDGEEETETFETFAEPDASDKELDQGDVKDATTADVMNEDVPSEDRFIYVDKDSLG